MIEPELCVLVLSNQGVLGLAYLVDLAGREIEGVSGIVLDGLCRNENVLRGVLIPILMEEL